MVEVPIAAVVVVVLLGTAIKLLAEGNAAAYARSDISCVPVTDIGPARLAVAWRRADPRPAVAAFVRACRTATGTAG